MQEEAYIQEIIEWAKAHGNRISYIVVVDMLKSKEKGLNTIDDVENVLEELADAGIIVENSEETEDYDQEDTQENGIYIPADVHITPRNITIDIIQDRLENNEIDMQPAFQRRGDLWTEIQQSRLIESLMLNIPIPTFYFDARDEEKWVIIDGLQRLTTLHKFMVSGELRLQGLEYLTEFNGCRFKDLPRQYYRRIRETQIQIYTIEKGTPERIVFNIFKRINTGGLHLEAQEIRHALYSGKATELIEKLAGMMCFKKATGHAIRTDRMLDCEYVTRYLAFTELDYQQEYEGNVDNFLIKAMKCVNNYNEEKIENIEKNFQDVMEKCTQLLGKYAFRKINPERKRGPINKALFEMWTVGVYHCSVEERKKLLQKKDRVLEKYIELLQRKDMVSAIRGSDKNYVVFRMNGLEKMLKEILND